MVKEKRLNEHIIKIVIHSNSGSVYSFVYST